MASKDSLEEQFREFVAARSAALLRTAYLLTGDWATAEDLLQTALTKTYLAWKRLGGIEAVEPYARRVMVNTSTSWWRRRWHGERPTEVLPERAGVDEIEQQLDRDLLWRHLRELPNRQRAVLVLRYYEDMSEAQTAAMLDISPGTVKSQTSRALATLRRRLGANAPELAPPASPASRPLPSSRSGARGAAGRTTGSNSRTGAAPGHRCRCHTQAGAVGWPTRAPPGRSAHRRAAFDRPAGRAAHRPGGRARRHGLRGAAVSELRGQHDNLTDGPARSYQVRPDELEGAVRETLSRQVARTRPLSVDPAGKAIRRANRIRRRRTAAGLALAAVTAVLLSVGMAQLGAETRRDGSPIVVIGDPDPANRPLPTVTIPGPAPVARSRGRPRRCSAPTDGGWCCTTSGRPNASQPLPGGDGWLVVGAPSTAGRSLWVVRDDGLVQVLLAGAGAIVLAPDSLQVAWRDGGDLLVAGVVGTQLIGAVRTPVPAAAEPVRFVADSVLVRLDPAGAGHTLWRPGAGPLPEALDRKSLNVYGRLPDGRLVGQVATTDPGRTCLAVLAPTRHLDPVRTGCGPDLSQDGVGGRLAGRAVAAGERGDRRGRPVSAGRPATARAGRDRRDGRAADDRGDRLERRDPRLLPRRRRRVWSEVDVGQVRAGKPASPAAVPGVPAGERPILVERL